MNTSLKTWMTCLFAVAMVAGCAAPAPVPFQLVDSESKVQWGTLFPDSQRIEVTVDGHVFNGFYIVAGGTAISQSIAGRRLFPGNTVTSFSSNSVRAHLTADNGKQLSCEFLFEFRRAIGECRFPSGAIFQLIADENTQKPDESNLITPFAFRCLHRICNQHGDGHRADAAWYRSNPACHFHGAIKVHVTAKLAAG